MHHPDTLRYSASHEWVRTDGERATIGITDHAQHELGDVVYLDLPAVGKSFRAGSVFGTVESVKAVSDLYCPVSGEVIEINEPLTAAPEGINNSPYDNGWLMVLRMSDPAELESLMDASAYESSAGSH
ncbi:MAG TPA: glycine cleavage system protein GcvH [Armatimonadota bacterium]|nr:glycine cleavage system protein GcvH [Armatimonadota bacterium]